MGEVTHLCPVIHHGIRGLIEKLIPNQGQEWNLASKDGQGDGQAICCVPVKVLSVGCRQSLEDYIPESHAQVVVVEGFSPYHAKNPYKGFGDCDPMSKACPEAGIGGCLLWLLQVSGNGSNGCFRSYDLGPFW